MPFARARNLIELFERLKHCEVFVVPGANHIASAGVNDGFATLSSGSSTSPVNTPSKVSKASDPKSPIDRGHAS